MITSKLKTGLGFKKALLTLLALATVAILAVPSSAVTEDQIVIQGAESGSHLRLSVDGSNLMVDGYMSPDTPTGCHFTQVRTAAVCPLSGVGSIEVNMGPNSDKIEVLSPLPVSLTTYLGAGSDKLIGNSEDDTCYPEATMRNRCIGGAGNDICITGPQNSDCVGGPGNDYCQASTGSDGCWGGSGDDVCVMGSGSDGCHGDSGDDTLYGGPESDKLYGGSGNDKLYGGGAADKLYGDSGRDYCDGQGATGKDYSCETGPLH